MRIKIDPERVYEECRKLSQCIRVSREHQRAMKRIGEETKECCQTETHKIMYVQWMGMIGQYERIIEFHEELVREMHSLCQDYEEMEKAIVKRIEGI